MVTPYKANHIAEVEAKRAAFSIHHCGFSPGGRLHDKIGLIHQKVSI